jgi:hypothetical protein
MFPPLSGIDTGQDGGGKLNCIAVVYTTASFCPRGAGTWKHKSISKYAGHSNGMSARRRWNKMSACRQWNMWIQDVFLIEKLASSRRAKMLFPVKQISFERECHSNARAIRIMTCFNDRLVHFYGGESDA